VDEGRVMLNCEARKLDDLCARVGRAISLNGLGCSLKGRKEGPRPIGAKNAKVRVEDVKKPVSEIHFGRLFASDGDSLRHVHKHTRGLHRAIRLNSNGRPTLTLVNLRAIKLSPSPVSSLFPALSAGGDAPRPRVRISTETS
jgi:hypothetical protein